MTFTETQPGENDVVLRARRTYWSVVLAPLTWAACAAVGELWIDLLTFVVGVGAILIETMFYPPWIRLGSSGLTFGSWFRTRHYPWAGIERFELGNPTIPDAAYVVLTQPRQVGTGPVVRLPHVAMEPEEVVRTLQSHFRRAEGKGTFVQ